LPELKIDMAGFWLIWIGKGFARNGGFSKASAELQCF